MASRFRIGAFVIALVAVLAITPSAFAKGGISGGGGGGTGGGGGGGVTANCAQILSFSNTPSYNADGAAVITTAYSVHQGCLDEFSGNITLIIHNDDTGFTGTSVRMTPVGDWTYSSTWPSGFGTRYTITLNVYAPNGQLAATQKQTVTALDAPVL